MALLIGDNFSYNGKKPNFERDSFETLAILKAFPEANIDNGHIAYCKETNKHYIFNDSNSDDPLTGKWRELESEFSNLIDSSDLEAYLTKDEAQSTYQPIGDYVLKSEIPSLDGYATEVWVNSQGFLRSIPEEYVTESELDAKDYITNTELTSKNYLTEIPSEYITETELASKNYATKDEIPDISNLALKSEIPTKVSQLENDSNYLTSVPDNYVTDTELQEAISGVQFELPIATDSVLGGIKVGAGLNITEDGILSATGGGTADAVNWENVIGRPTNLSQFTNDSGFITSDDLPDLSNYATQSWVQEQGYLTSIPDNYITDEELNDKGYLTQVPDEYITETELNAKGYLTQIPEEYITETELTEAINTTKYTLPIASTDVLGGIKVGAGLSINAETGVLSATGGGTADSVDWNNVLSKPDWITNTKPTYNYTEIEGNIPINKLPIATTTSVGVIKIGSGLTIDGEGLLSATGSTVESIDWSKIDNVPNWITSTKPVYNYTEINGTIESSDLPVASNNTLGAVKVGEGLQIRNGILSTTGEVNVDWEDINGRPTDLIDFTNNYGYMTQDNIHSYIQDVLKTINGESLIDEGSGPKDISTIETYVIGKLFGYVSPSTEQITSLIGSWDGLRKAIEDHKVILMANDVNTEAIPSTSAVYAETDSANVIHLIGFVHSAGSTIKSVNIHCGTITKTGSELKWTENPTISVIDELDPVDVRPVSSSIIYEALTKKQDELISGETLKTINGTSLLGSGNIVIESGGSGSEITDVLDDKIYARTQGSWKDLTDWLTWAEYD